MHLIVSISLNFHFQGYHPSVKTSTTKAHQLFFETGKEIHFFARLREIDVDISTLTRSGWWV